MATQATNLRPHLTLPVSARDHIQGPASASVTLVEYGDYLCPHCRHAHSVITELQERMGYRMRLVFRNFPLTTIHADAQNAAGAAQAAGAQEKYWPMHDHLFTHQPHLDEQSLLSYAAELGLDNLWFTQDVQSHPFASRVREDFSSGVRSGVNGTPPFFINGVRHDGSWDLDALTTAIWTALDDGSAARARSG